MPQIRVVWMVLSGIASNQPVTIFFQSRVHIDTYILQAKVSNDLNHFEPTLISTVISTLSQLYGLFIEPQTAYLDL